jgi:hypothetical protein
MKLTFLNAHLQWIPEYPLSSVALRVRIDSSEIICDGGWGSDDQIVHFQREIQLRDDVYVGGQFTFHVDLVALLNETGSESRTIGSGVCTLFAEDTNERTRMIALINTKMKIIMAQLLVSVTPHSVLAEGQPDVAISVQADGILTLPVMDIAHEGTYSEAENENEKSFSFSSSRASCLTTQPTMKTQKKSNPVPSNADVNLKLGAGKDSCKLDVPPAQGEVDSDNVEISLPLDRTVKSTEVKNESYRLSIEDVRKPSRMLQDNTFQAMKTISEKVLKSDYELGDGVDAERNTFKKSNLIPPDPLELGSSSESDSDSEEHVREKNSKSLKLAGKHLKSNNLLNTSQQLKVTEACQRVKAVIQKNKNSNEKRKSVLMEKKSVNKSHTRRVHQSDNMRTRPKEETEFTGSSDPIFDMQNRLRAAEKRRAQILQSTKEKARQLALKDTIKSEAIKKAILHSSLEFNKLRNKFDKRNSVLDREHAAQEAKFRCGRGRRNVRTYSSNGSHDSCGEMEGSRSFNAFPPAVTARTTSRNNYSEAGRVSSASEGREYERRSVTAIPYSNLRLRSQSLGREREKEKDRVTTGVKYDDVKAEYTAAAAEDVAHTAQTTMKNSYRAADTSRRMKHQQVQSQRDPLQPDLEGTAVEPTVRSGISKSSNRIKELESDTFGEYAADLTGHHNQNLLITLVLDRVEAIKSRIPTSSKADVKNMLIMIERLVTLAIALNAIVKIDTAASGRSKKALNAVPGSDDVAVKDLRSATPSSVQPNITQIEPKPSSNVQENTVNIPLRNPSCDWERSILKPTGEEYSKFSNIATIKAVPILTRTLDPSIPLTHDKDAVNITAEDSFYSLESVASSSSSVSSADSLEEMSEKFSFERKRSTTNEAILAYHPMQDGTVDVRKSSIRDSELHDKRIDKKDEGGWVPEKGKVGVWSNTSSSSSSSDNKSSQSTGSTGSTVSSVDILIKNNMKARSSIITRCTAPVIHHHNHSPPRTPAERVDPFKAVNMMESLPQKRAITRERSSGDVGLDVDAVAFIGSGAGTYQWSGSGPGTGVGSEASTGSGTGDVSSDIALVSRAIDNLQVRQLRYPSHTSTFFAAFPVRAHLLYCFVFFNARVFLWKDNNATATIAYSCHILRCISSDCA